MQFLELRQIVVIASRHSTSSQQELREERHVEADEHERAADLSKLLVVHTAEHLWPPVMQSTQERNHCAAHHYVVEVRNDEVRVVKVNIDSQRSKINTRQSTNGKQHQEGN